MNSSSQLDIFELNELASEKNGGKILFATDDWFATAENLLTEEEPVWKDGIFTEFGKWMDGWETRRKRSPGHDWAIIALKYPCIIKGCCIDTAYFTGNYAPRISIQAARLDESDITLFPIRMSKPGTAAAEKDLVTIGRFTEQWTTIVPMSDLAPGVVATRKNYFRTLSNDSWTHLRLNLFPDGGVARLRVYGHIVPQLNEMDFKKRIDLIARENGGICQQYSNAYYGHPRNLISSGNPFNMADGWETARRIDRPAIIEVDHNGILKVTGNEWAIFKLGYTGLVDTISIDTTNFKGNFPDNAKVEGVLVSSDELDNEFISWKTILPVAKLCPHKLHTYHSNDLYWHGPVSHIKVTISPDGGISRLRLWGYIQY